ncbi:MAG TPA: aldehyde dehydrogenase family protein [bacterium]|nr:aldehyde dehydrogenase family protein [bacterium]HPQ65742.1 aldehyde dehydrogenase family protein [bacterium]
MKKSIPEIVAGQRACFQGGFTRSPAWRKAALAKLKSALGRNEKKLLAALRKDLGKAAVEAYTSEVGFVLAEIDYALRHLGAWSRSRKPMPPLLWFPSETRIVPEPKGVVLIIGPWNYPVALCLSPLVGALAAGCTAVVKPSEVASESSRAIAEVIGETFGDDSIAVVEGGAAAAGLLLEEEFDHIFYTGGPRVGKIVMAKAAEHLTPVTLELGGKNPCIVDREVDCSVAARRIAWGKFFNAGQTCVAPDYLLVPAELKDPMIENLKKAIVEFYGPDPRHSPDYARIINERHLSRLLSLLEEGDIVVGGGADRENRYLAPTVIDNVNWDNRIMGEEIFGPILPVIGYGDLAEATGAVNARPAPLALYFFSRNRERQRMVIRETRSGGACINDTIIQILPRRLPFGGIGPSGMGSYHGRATFDTFTHYRSVVTRSFRFDVPLRYPPYRTSLDQVKKFFRFLS